MKVFEALYNENPDESGYSTISIHLTREGAKKAIENHKRETKEFWTEPWGGESWESMKDMMRWKIGTTKILP